MKREVIDKLSTLITAAWGFVAALAWNEAVKSLFVEGGVLYFLAQYGVWVYAILVTFFALFVTIWIGKASQKFKGEKSK